ncbi:MAG TPA: hypothetical protein VMC85_09105 [Desulfomonilaceae bacterium]|nr:hypothetical protein [Desulfomonilaceae bacterium]
MPREAQLFDSCSGSAVKGFLKLKGNIPPRWIDNAHTSRKTVEPSIEKCMRKLQNLRKKHPRAKIAIKSATKDLREVLNQWELRYRKEAFYRGIRTLLDINRDGASEL